MTPTNTWLADLRSLMLKAPDDPEIRHLGCAYVTEHLGSESTTLEWLKLKAVGRLSDCLSCLSREGTALTRVQLSDPQPDPPPPSLQAQFALLSGPVGDAHVEFGLKMFWGEDISHTLELAALPLADGRMWTFSADWPWAKDVVYEHSEASTESILAYGLVEAFKARAGGWNYLHEMVRGDTGGVPYVMWKDTHGHSPSDLRERQVLSALRYAQAQGATSSD